MSEAAAWPSALGARALDSSEGVQALEAFAADYGRKSLLLLLHASVPETLRPDMLHLIRVNFVPEADDPSFEADVLFAPLTQPLGGRRFRVEPQVRRHALVVLRSLYRHEARSRVQRVAELMWRHLERLARGAGAAADAGLAEYLEVQRWVALAHLDPAGAAHAFAQALEAQAALEPVARLRLGGLAAAIELPLAAQPELIAYARGLDALEGGDVVAARHWLGRVGEEPLEIGGVTLRPVREWLAETGQGVARKADGEPTAEAVTEPLAEGMTSQSATGTSAAAETSVMLVRGDECEGDGSVDTEHDLWLRTVQDVLVSLPGCRLARSPRTNDVASNWARLLRDLASADHVVVVLHPQRRSTWLLLGMAWALRASGVTAIGPPLMRVERRAGGFAVHGGDGLATLETTAELRAALQRELAQSRATPPYAARPGWLPARPGARLLPKVPPSERWHEPPKGCVMIGFAAEARQVSGGMPSAPVERELHRMKVDPVALGKVDPLATPVAEWIDPLLGPEMALANWSADDPRALTLVGLRLVFDPWGCVTVAGVDTPAGVTWRPPGLRVLEYAGGDDKGGGRFGQALRQWQPHPNPLYAAWPELQPPSRPSPPQPPSKTAPVRRVFLSYASVYADVARPLAEALQGEDIDLFSDLRLAAGDPWRERLADWLREADAVVAVVGPETVRRESQMAEIRTAVARGQRMIPVVVDTDDLALLPPEILERQAIVIGRSQRQGRRLDAAIEEAVARIRQALDQPLPSASAATERPPLVLSIRRPKPELLRFEFGDEARLVRVELAVSMSLVGPLLQRLDESRTLDPGLVPTLRELLLPVELKSRFDAAQPTGTPWPLGLRLDESAATLPWELVLGAPSKTPPKGWSPPPLIRYSAEPPVPSTLPPTALMVGDPSTAGSSAGSDRYDPLPGAAEEVKSAAETLRRAGFDVTVSVHEDARAVIGHLLERPYRVLHLAGQGEVVARPDGSNAASMVLSDEARLGAPELEAMRQAPELLLLNVCWLGQLGHASSGQFNQQAVAPRLLRAGTVCIVAPDRPVDDGVARHFMDTLLSQLCDGASIDVAVAAARAAAWRQRPDDVTWAAYRVWAPAGYTLDKAAAATHKSPIPRQKPAATTKAAPRARTPDAPRRKPRPKKLSKLAQAKK